MAVSNYLVHEGIDKDRIAVKAYGESLPVVPCYHKDCSEEDYQKNRRAEFVLSHGFRIPETPLPKSKPKS
jgi:outer membrane protein OmpA-like peptidoglycan-associated protein